MRNRTLFVSVAVALLAIGMWHLSVATADSSEARRLVAAGAALIDVRTPEEFATGHISGARNIPVDELSGRLAEVGQRSRPVVVYCSAGVRSARAAQILTAAGFKRVCNLGPMSAW